MIKPKILPNTLSLRLKAQGINLNAKLLPRWLAVKKHLTKPVNLVDESYGFLRINNFYLANNSKMRLQSHLDWCYYDAKDLADAIENNSVDVYYEQQLSDVRSDPNKWKRSDEELELKSFYAARKGRANLI
jgi:3D (Asp-Asp-Asp) domain-containing protein